MAAFAIFFLQSAFPIIPYPVVAGAAGLVFGRLSGFLLAYLGALSGAAALFGLVHRLSGDRFVKHIMNKYRFDLAGLEPWKVFAVLLIARLFPIIPTQVIAIGSALSGVPFRIFFLSTMLGKLLWPAVYVYLGYNLLQSDNLMGTIKAALLVMAIALAGTAFFSKRLPIRKRA